MWVSVLEFCEGGEWWSCLQDTFILMLIAIINMLQSVVIFTVIVVVIESLISKAGQPNNWYSIHSRSMLFSLLWSIHSSTGAQSGFCLVAAGLLSSWVMGVGCEADHMLQPRCKFKNVCGYTCTALYIWMGMAVIPSVQACKNCLLISILVFFKVTLV